MLDGPDKQSGGCYLVLRDWAAIETIRREIVLTLSFETIYKVQ